MKTFDLVADFSKIRVPSATDAGKAKFCTIEFEAAGWVLEEMNLVVNYAVYSRGESKVYAHQTMREWELVVKEFLGLCDEDVPRLPIPGPTIAVFNTNFDISEMLKGIPLLA